MTTPEEMMALTQQIAAHEERIEQLEFILSQIIEEDDAEPMEIAHRELVRGLEARREGSA